MEQKFYICEHCGNIIAYAEHTGPDVMCCGQKMTPLVPNTTDAAVEKHVPVFKVEGQHILVEVSTVQHPMTEAHHISWIVVESKQGNQRKMLDPTGAPQAEFMLTEDDELVAIYAYCNLHGLWKAE